MNRFRSLTVRGFRRLASVDVELRPLTVLIGANGVGKSSFLDALSLLASSAQGRLNEAVNDMAGLAAMMTYDRASEVGFGISMTVPGHKPLDYSLSLRPNGQAYLINQETLTQELGARGRRLLVESRGAGVKYDGTPATWEIGLLESALSQVPKSSRELEKFRRKLASSTFYHALNVEPRSPVRLPQTMRPATLPGRNGEDLVTSLYYLRETEPDRFEAVEDALKAAFPGFRKLDFPPVAAGTLAMLWRDSNFSQPMYTHQLSEGMLRFLWLATLLQSRGLTELTLLDEPEVSLHPELLSLLAGLLREAASRRTQIVVATHSDRLIRFLKPEEVLVMDYADDGTASLTWADQMNLEQWLEEYTLDELWSNGRLGARG